MGALSFSDLVSGNHLMVAGLKANIDRLKRRGLDDAFVSSLEAMNASLMALNAEQEALKSKLKAKTAELEGTMDRLKAKAGEARKVIKLEIPQTGWKEFGISDAR